MMLLVTGLPSIAFANTSPDSSKLQNGSFETFGDSRFASGAYKQLQPGDSDYWKTTAETNKIELLRENNGAYINGQTVRPADGDVAAELNADEESTLYQIVNTESSSVYEWGLFHAARTERDTMALIIGPNQEVEPSKNWGEGYESSDLNYANPAARTGYKYGKDQMMQMVAWLKATGRISGVESAGMANGGRPIVLYSKKFDVHGGFADNADNSPFSMKPSSIYTEKWNIWIITDRNTKDSGGNLTWSGWTGYGLNSEGESESPDNSLDMNSYYHYQVPSDQNRTLFAFTSIENETPPGKSRPDPTYGNFLDGVNFRIYRLLSGSTTEHGSAVIESSDGTTSGEGETEGYKVSTDSSVMTYIKDGSSLTIEGVVKKDDIDEVNFTGVYSTSQKADGNGVETVFIPLTDSGWKVETSEEGNRIYKYVIENVTSAIDLHFVFIRSPRITYDSNGGKPYDCNQNDGADADEPSNVYNFKPVTEESGIRFIEPYESHVPEGQNDGWKFTGWKLFDGEGAVEGTVPGVHKVAYNQYPQDSDESNRFMIIGEDGSFVRQDTDGNSAVWETSAARIYDKVSPGLSFVAQWRWRQVFKPVTYYGKGAAESDEGGKVEIENASGENYDGEYTAEGAKAYYAGVNENVTAKAEAADGYSFDGWYDEGGNLITQSETMTYTESKEAVSEYYAHFSRQYTQIYKRQILVDGEWTTLADDDLSKVELLDRTLIRESYGAAVSSTASNNSEYSLEGWYDKNGNPVDENIISNGGRSISYTVKGDAEYYARFLESRTVLFKMQFLNDDGTLLTLPDSSTAYGTLSAFSASSIAGGTVSSKAYPAVGYQFVGWYDGSDENASKVSCADPTDSRVIMAEAADEEGRTYYARFEARNDTQYRVQHYFKGWKTEGSYYLLENKTYYGRTGASVTPSPAELTGDKEGYRCVTEIKPGTISANGTTVFKLYYDKDETSLNYNGNPPEGLTASGSVESTAGYVGCDVKVSSNDGGFVVDGYFFNGWNTSADGSGSSYFADDDYTLFANSADASGNVVNPNVLYARWAADSAVEYKVQHYKLSIDEEGNYSVSENPDAEDSMYASAGERVTGESKEFQGYEYVEGFSADGITSADSGQVTEDGNLVLKLYYKPLEDTIIYKANGGAEADVIDGGYMYQKVTAKDGSSMFTRPGYTFNGWKTPSGTSCAPGSEYTLTTGDDVLLAQWKANTDTEYRVYHYLVSSDGTAARLVPEGTDGISSNPVVQKGTTGKTVTASPLTIDGYTYRSDYDSNGMKTVYSGIIAGNGGLVLKLYYIPEPASLIYDANGGKGERIQVTGSRDGSETVEGSLFTRPGYKFAGWNTQSDGSGDAYEQGDAYTLSSSESVLYAQWVFDSEQCAETMHFQMVWIDAEGNLVDFNKTGEESPSADVPGDSVQCDIEVSDDGGKSWSSLQNKYTAEGEAQTIENSDRTIERGPGKLFADVGSDAGKVYWTRTFEKDEYNLPVYNDEGSTLSYRMVEKASSLPEGWKNFTGSVAYSDTGAAFTNPVTGEIQKLEYYRYDDTHFINKKDYQENVFIINYDSRKPITLVVSKIDGSSSTSENKVPLEGAAFALYEKSDKGNVVIGYSGDQVSCEQIGGTEVTALNMQGTSADAVFEEALMRGREYYLVETSAPAGYRLLSEARKIVVDSDGTKAEIDYNEKDIVSDRLEIELGNYLSITMPSAGINITGRFYAAAGLLMMLAALMLLTRLKFRKNNAS